MNNRNITIDIAKGLGIVLVVLGHNWIAQENTELFEIIFSFHMPLFFFLAGVFVGDNNNIIDFIIKKTDALLKPYFVVLLVLGLVKISVLKMTGKGINFDVGEYFYGVVYATGNTIEWVVLWFLPHLFITSVASFCVIKIINKNSNRPELLTFFSVVILFVGIHWINIFWNPVVPLDKNFIGVSGYPGLPWSIDLIPITSAYLILGYLIRSKVTRFSFDIYGFILSIVFFALFHYFFNEKIDFNLRIYGDPIISTTQAFLGIYLILSLASLINKHEIIARGVAYIGSGSFYILIFHVIVQLKAFNVMMRVSSNIFLNAFVGLIFGVLVPLIFFRISRRSKIIS